MRGSGTHRRQFWLKMEVVFRPTGGVPRRSVLLLDAWRIVGDFIGDDAVFGRILLTERWSQICFRGWLRITSALWETFSSAEAEENYQRYRDLAVGEEVERGLAIEGAVCGCEWVAKGQLDRCLVCDSD